MLTPCCRIVLNVLTIYSTKQRFGTVCLADLPLAVCPVSSSGNSSMKIELDSAKLRPAFLHLASIGVVIGFFVSLRVFAGSIADNDAYYHIKLSYLLRTEGLPGGLPWLQFTLLRDRFVDQHFLFHVLNIPFTFLDLVLAAKVSAVVWSLLAFGTFWLLLVRLRVPFGWFWPLALLAVSWPFLYRMNMSRVPALSVAFQMLALICFFERRYKWLVAVAFLYVWLYQLFVVLIPIAVIFTFVEWCHERRVNWRYLGATVAGIALGLVINPFFPSVFRFFYEHAILTASNTAGLKVGAEWYPYESKFLVRSSWGAFAGMFAGVYVASTSRSKLSAQAQCALLMAMMFLAAFVRSRRFVEYFPVYGLIFAALAFRDHLRAGVFDMKSRLMVLGSWILLGAVSAGIGVNWRRALRDLNGNSSPERYRGAALWISQHSQPKDIVFTTDWDDFPELFFYDHKNYYIVGLDVNLMYWYDQRLFSTWERLTRGELEQPSSYIRREFGARFVFSDQSHEAFRKRAERDSGLAKVFEDRNTIVWRVNEERAGDELLIEAETLYPPHATSPDVHHRIQNLAKDVKTTCSADQSILAETQRDDDFVELKIPLRRAGRYEIGIGHIRAADYGCVEWSVNGTALPLRFDGYHDSVDTSETVRSAPVELAAGDVLLRATVRGTNAHSRGRKMGLDYICLRKAN